MIFFLFGLYGFTEYKNNIQWLEGRTNFDKLLADNKGCFILDEPRAKNLLMDVGYFDWALPYYSILFQNSTRPDTIFFTQRWPTYNYPNPCKTNDRKSFIYSGLFDIHVQQGRNIIFSPGIFIENI